MDNNQLIENYVDSIVYELDIKNRKEIKEELESVILHILTIECGNEIPQKEDVLRVLNRLGNTNFNTKRHFISGIYYHKYKITVRILVFITCVIITLINLTDYLIDHMGSYEFISNLFVYNVMGISIIFTGITIFYYLLEKYRMNFEKEIFYSNCSGNKTELIKDKGRIKLYEPILDIMISLLFTVIFTGKFSFVERMFRNTEVYYIIDFKELTKLWYMIVGVGILGIVIAIVKIVDGRYTNRVIIVSTIINLLMIMVTIIVFNENTVLKSNLVRLIIITVIVVDIVFTMKKGLKEKDAISSNHISQ